jgi:hypothetical protein
MQRFDLSTLEGNVREKNKIKKLWKHPQPVIEGL